MSRFDYVAIFYGIVVAMAAETVLASCHRLLAARSRVRWHWMAPVTAVNATLVTLGEFWTLWSDRGQWTGGYSFFQFLPFAISLFLMFLSAAATLPDEVPPEGLDLKAFYFDNRRHYWGLVAGFFGFNVLLNCAELLRPDGATALPRDLPRLAGDLLAIGLAAPLILWRSYWLHAVGILLAMAILLLFLSSISFA